MTQLTNLATEFMTTFPRPSLYAPPLAPEGTGLPPWKDGVDDWAGMCAQACFRLASWIGWDHEPLPPYETATVARLRSGPLHGVSTDAPPNSWHWFGQDDNDGHVIYDCDGGGTVCFEGYKNPAIMVGAAIGFDSVQGTIGKLPSEWPYLGWSDNYAGGKIVLPAEDTIMKIIRNPNGTLTAVGETTYQHYKTVTDYLCDALLYGPYLQCNDDTYRIIVANTQVRKAYLFSGTGSGSGGAAVDAAAIAAAVDKSLQDDFAKLSAEIDGINATLGAPDIAKIAAASASATTALLGKKLTAK